MPAHSEKRRLPYAAEDVFDLVLDIEKYPEFLPWCLEANIKARRKNELDADVAVGFGPFREVFSSRVRFSRPEKIEVDYMKGPMKSLVNRWVFTPVKDGCEVDFYVDFSMKARLLDVLIAGFFDRALARMVSAFEARAKKIYGRKKIRKN